MSVLQRTLPEYCTETCLINGLIFVENSALLCVMKRMKEVWKHYPVQYTQRIMEQQQYFFTQSYCLCACFIDYLYKEHTYLESLKIDLYLGLLEEHNCELHLIKSYNTRSSTAVSLLFCLGSTRQFVNFKTVTGTAYFSAGLR